MSNCAALESLVGLKKLGLYGLKSNIFMIIVNNEQLQQIGKKLQQVTHLGLGKYFL
jgi:hypothetical protein